MENWKKPIYLIEVIKGFESVNALLSEFKDDVDYPETVPATLLRIIKELKHHREVNEEEYQKAYNVKSVPEVKSNEQSRTDHLLGHTKEQLLEQLLQAEKARSQAESDKHTLAETLRMFLR